MKGPRPFNQRTEPQAGRQLNDADRARAELARLLNRIPFLAGGRPISVRFVAATAKTVKHGLGTPATFIVIRPNYDGTANNPAFREGDQTGLDANTQLAIVASTNCDVDLWFYPRSSQPIDATAGQSP